MAERSPQRAGHFKPSALALQQARARGFEQNRVGLRQMDRPHAHAWRRQTPAAEAISADEIRHFGRRVHHIARHRGGRRTRLVEASERPLERAGGHFGRRRIGEQRSDRPAAWSATARRRSSFRHSCRWACVTSFRFRRRTETLVLAIRASGAEGPVLRAALAGERRDLTDRQLLRAALAVRSSR